MKRRIAAILLLVAMAFCITNAGAEKSMEELNAEFDQLMHEYDQLQAIQDVFDNGLGIYPASGWEAEYGLKCDTEFPAFDTKEDGEQYRGMPYLLTGTCLDVKGYGIDFQLGDGRLAIIAFDAFDPETGSTILLGDHPKKGERCNVYCTYKTMCWELLDPNCLHFYAGVTEQVKQLTLK